jgi:Mg2+/Co2+ transporter CorB
MTPRLNIVLSMMLGTRIFHDLFGRIFTAVVKSILLLIWLIFLSIIKKTSASGSICDHLETSHRLLSKT